MEGFPSMAASDDIVAPMTPYLDRRLPLPVRPALDWRWMTVVTVIVSVPATVALIRWIDRHDDLIMNLGAGDALRFLLGLIGSYLAVIAIHELGHIAGGLAAGFRFQHVRISAMLFHRTNGLSFHRGTASLVTGEAKLLPPPGEVAPSSYAVMVFAGPAANLLCAAACAFFSPRVFLVLSLIVGLGDLMPFETSLAVTDGARLRMLFFDRPRRERWMAIVRLSAESSDGKQSEKMSAPLLAQATAVRDESRDTPTAYAFAYSAAMHRREFASAGDVLEVCLQYAAHTSPNVRAALISDAAVYQAAIRHDAALASAWLADLPPTARPWLRERVEAAILQSVQAHGD
jgi:hypothetical protein